MKVEQEAKPQAETKRQIVLKAPRWVKVLREPIRNFLLIPSHGVDKLAENYGPAMAGRVASATIGASFGIPFGLGMDLHNQVLTTASFLIVALEMGYLQMTSPVDKNH